MRPTALFGFGGCSDFGAFGARGDDGWHEGRDVGFADHEGGFRQFADENQGAAADASDIKGLQEGEVVAGGG